MTPRIKRKSSRAGIFLLLYVLTLVGISRTIAGMESLPEKLGALSVPVVLLGLGCWFAFKEGGLGSRISASVLAVLALGSFGFGAMQGFTQLRGAREVDSELEQLRAGVIADSSDPNLGPEAARRHMDRMQGAARRMQASDHAETAALGRALEVIAGLTLDSDQRLLTALDGISSERFLDASNMLETGDFGLQKAVAQEYGAAAKASSDLHAKLPDAVTDQLAKSDVPAEASRHVVNGVRKTWPLGARVFQWHVRTAEAYEAIIDFLEEHHAEIDALDDESLDFADGETESAYEGLIERASAAEAQRDAAIDELVQAVAKR